MDDRALVFSILAGPAHYAHESGKEMTAMIPGGAGPHRGQEKKMLRAGDQHFDIIMRMFTIEQASRIAKTWLIHYQLPLDPSRLKNFDLFHERCGPWVLENAQHIKAY